MAKHVAGPVIRASAMVREGRLHSSANGRRQPLQMHQVRYFLALCDELNFTRAARRCGISQPSLTQAIRALERELGGALFHREPSIALTRLARAVRPYLDKIARNADHAREVARTVTPRRRARGK